MNDGYERARKLVDAMGPAERQRRVEELVAKSGRVWAFACQVYGTEMIAASSLLAIGTQTSVQLGIDPESIESAVRIHIEKTTEVLAGDRVAEVEKVPT